MLRKIRYQYILFFTFAATVVTALFCSALYFYQYNMEIIQRELQKSYKQVSIVIASKLDTCLYDMDTVLKHLHVSPDVMNIVKRVPSSPVNWFDVNPRNRGMVKDVIIAALASDNLSGSIAVITNKSYDFLVQSSAVRGSNMTRERLKSDPQVAQAMQSSAFSMCFAPSQSIWTSDPVTVVTVSRPLRDTFNTYGVAMYSRDIQSINDYVTFAVNAESYSLILADQNMNFLFASQNCANARALLSARPASDARDVVYTATVEGQSYFVASAPMVASDWNVLIVHSAQDFRDQERELMRTLLLIYGAAMLVLLALLYLFAHSLTKPLRQLRERIENAVFEDTPLFTCVSAGNEVVMLGEAMEGYVHKIQQQHLSLLALQKSEMQAYFDAMNAQLNPHFLYNTLNTISAFGNLRGNIEVEKMCAELARMLRYSINPPDGGVTLASELDNIRSYLYIMQMRYDNLLNITWDLDESIQSTYVPRLILQPIVENCFKHGFADKEPPWVIRIQTRREQDGWVAVISNNGAPFSDEALAHLQAYVSAFKQHFETNAIAPESINSVGVTNTLIRLYIYYRGEERFSITHTDDMTHVLIGALAKSKNTRIGGTNDA